MTKKLSKEEKDRRKAERKVRTTVAKPVEEIIPEHVVAEEPVEELAQGIPVQNLKLGQRFELDGDIFVVKTMDADGAIAAKLEWPPNGGEPMVERWQRPVLSDTLVMPRE